MKHNVYLYILIMAAVSFLIRVLPLTLIRREIKNKTIRSFLYFSGTLPLADVIIRNTESRPVARFQNFPSSHFLLV